MLHATDSRAPCKQSLSQDYATTDSFSCHSRNKYYTVTLLAPARAPQDDSRHRARYSHSFTLLLHVSIVERTLYPSTTGIIHDAPLCARNSSSGASVLSASDDPTDPLHRLSFHVPSRPTTSPSRRAASMNPASCSTVWSYPGANRSIVWMRSSGSAPRFVSIPSMNFQ